MLPRTAEDPTFNSSTTARSNSHSQERSCPERVKTLQDSPPNDQTPWTSEESVEPLLFCNKILLRDNLFHFILHVVVFSEVLHGMFSMGDAVVHGLLDSKHDLNWDEDQVDANNDLTFGDGAVEDDWRANHTKVFGPNNSVAICLVYQYSGGL